MLNAEALGGIGTVIGAAGVAGGYLFRHYAVGRNGSSPQTKSTAALAKVEHDELCLLKLKNLSLEISKSITAELTLMNEKIDRLILLREP